MGVGIKRTACTLTSFHCPPQFCHLFCEGTAHYLHSIPKSYLCFSLITKIDDCLKIFTLSLVALNTVLQSVATSQKIFDNTSFCSSKFFPVHLTVKIFQACLKKQISNLYMHYNDTKPLSTFELYLVSYKQY